MRIKGVVCDLDGTLIDSESVHMEAWNEVIRRLGHTPPANAWHEEYVGMPDSFAADKIIGMFQGIGQSCPELIEMKQVVYRELVRKKGPELAYPGVRDRLEKLKAAGMGLAVATNSILLNTQVSLEAAGLGDIFEHLVTIDLVEHGKPAPDIPLGACRRLGLSPGECVVLEDSPAGLGAARAAGCPGLAITNTMSGAELNPRDQLFENTAAALDWVAAQNGL